MSRGAKRLELEGPRRPRRKPVSSLRFGPFRTSRVRTAQGRVHLLEIEGSGQLPPVLLLHGLAGSALTYWPVFRRLRQHVRKIIAPDLPAHGLSDTPRSGLGTPAMRMALLQALDAVLEEPLVIFGNSLGGYAALDFARLRPWLVRGVVVASPGGAAMSEETLASMRAVFQLDSHAEALDFVDRLLARPSRLRTLYALGVRRRFARPEMQGILRSLKAADLLAPEHLAALRMPLLLLWGRGERILPAENLEFFRRHLPAHAVVEEPEGQGHCPYLDDADGLVARLLTFIRSLASGPL